MFPREICNMMLMQFFFSEMGGRANKVYYGRCANGEYSEIIGQFRVAPRLYFKARLNTKLLIWSDLLFSCKLTYFHNKGFALGRVMKMRVL